MSPHLRNTALVMVRDVALFSLAVVKWSVQRAGCGAECDWYGGDWHCRRVKRLFVPFASPQEASLNQCPKRNVERAVPLEMVWWRHWLLVP